MVSNSTFDIKKTINYDLLNILMINYLFKILLHEFQKKFNYHQNEW